MAAERRFRISRRMIAALTVAAVLVAVLCVRYLPPTVGTVLGIATDDIEYIEITEEHIYHTPSKDAARTTVTAQEDIRELYRCISRVRLRNKGSPLVGGHFIAVTLYLTDGSTVFFEMNSSRSIYYGGKTYFFRFPARIFSEIEEILDGYTYK